MNILNRNHWKHLNLILLFVGVLFGIFLYNFEPFHRFLLSLNNFGYIGAFIAGILYDSTVTVSTSIVIFLVLAEELPRLEVGLIAACGAVLGDLIIFRFVKHSLMGEFKFIFQTFENGVGKKRTRTLKVLLHSRYFNWMLPVVAALMIGSPFPEEIAWALMGATKIKTYQVVLVSFVFNFIGIVLIMSASNFVKP